MGKEIERKFLLRGLPAGISKGIKILKGYLSAGDPEVRVRSKGERFFLTRKGGGGFVREEEEHEISNEIFNILWPLTQESRIEKTRYAINSDDGLLWEIDEFHTALTEGLFLAEVELPGELAQFEIPSAISEVIERDVTSDEMYKNKNLASYGAPIQH